MVRFMVSPEIPNSGPFVLKPHGSLNWFEGDLGQRLKSDRRTVIFTDESNSNVVCSFDKFRTPKSKEPRKYVPLIVPPVFSKGFCKTHI